jgi:DNA-binding NarL/FixJ family response regulator
MIVDDHPALREGLGHRISAQPDMLFCGHASDVHEALARVGELAPDVVIVDIVLKSSDGLELIKAIRSRHKSVRTLVHSMYEESLYADRCLHAGAMGYVNKESEPDDVIRAIREILAGRVYLSPGMMNELIGRSITGEAKSDLVDTLTDRQLEIFRLIGDGLSAHQIADRLHISVHTVETHRENIKRKLYIDTASELTRRAALWAAKNA